VLAGLAHGEPHGYAITDSNAASVLLGYWLGTGGYKEVTQFEKQQRDAGRKVVAA
jgi:hypothetical protein